MDDEDGLLGGALELQEPFAGKGSGEGSEAASGWLTGENAPPLVKDLIVAADRSIGVRLLQRMGWRAGHGVGARVPMSEGDVHGGIAKAVIPIGAFDELTGQVTRAPEDFRVRIPPPKDDLHGLGFERKAHGGLGSGRERRVAAYHVSDLFNKSSKVAIDSYVYDDEADAYGSHSKDLFDVDHYGEEEVSIDEEEPGMTRREVTARWVSGASLPTTQTCPSDGRSVLEGFILASTIPPMEDVAPKVEVPESYVPCSSLSEDTVPKPRQSRWSDAPQVPVAPPETAVKEPTPEEILSATRDAEERRSRFSGLSEAFRSRFVSASSKLSSSSTNTDEKLKGLKSVGEFSANMAESKLHDERGRANESPKVLPDVKREGRTTVTWIPVPLLCKRFNVPVPSKSSHSSITMATQPKDRGDELFEKHIGAYISVPEKSMSESVRPVTEAPNSFDDLLVSAAMSVTVRPEMTMLKSIFDSDSEDDEQEDPPANSNADSMIIKSASIVSAALSAENEVAASDTPIVMEGNSSYLQKNYVNAENAHDLLENSSIQSVATDSKIIFKRPSRPSGSADQPMTERKEGQARKSSDSAKRKNVLSFSFDD